MKNKNKKKTTKIFAFFSQKFAYLRYHFKKYFLKTGYLALSTFKTRIVVINRENI